MARARESIYVIMLNYLVHNKNKLILGFTVAYLFAFTLNGLMNGNLEFLYYTIIMSVLIYFIIVVEARLHLAFFILVNLSILGFLHLLGGNFYVNNVRLYDYYFIPDIRYDNIIHTYGTFIATVALYSLTAHMIYARVRQQYYVYAIMLILMAIGIGTLNELVEFAAVVFFDAQEQVGGYFNNSLDLMFNTLGAIIGTLVIYIYKNPPRFIKQISDQSEENN